MLDQFSGTIDKIYAAAAGHCGWKEALAAVETLTGSAGAVIDLIPITPAANGKTLAGSFTEENCAEYARDYQAICPRIRFAVERPDVEIQFDYLFISEAEMDRDPVYDWFGKHGLRYYLGSRLARTENYIAVASLQRTRKQGHAQADDIRLLELLKPHLARAASLADQLGTLRTFDRFSSAVLEALPQAVFALDDAGRIGFANRRARSILNAADGLSGDSGGLKTALASDQLRLDRLISEAAVPTPLSSGGWTRVSRPSGKLSYALFVAPLPPVTEELLQSRCSVIVIVHDQAVAHGLAAEVLRELYALTETEARLANALARGHSVESAAATLGMKIATARSHLKAIFAKTGVNRQQDLVRLLTSLSGLSL